MKLTHLWGAIAYKDRRMFDDKMTSQAELCFNGLNGSVARKTKLERYFIAIAALLREVLDFAELEDMEEITFDCFQYASTWGFLANCVLGSTGAISEPDAWPYLCRHIDHGRKINFDAPRDEAIQNKVLEDL